MIKKITSVLFVLSLLSLTFPNTCLSNEINIQSASITEAEASTVNQAEQFLSDSFFRRLFGLKKKTEAEKRSNSQRHSANRPQRYSPPPSSSQNPQTHNNTRNSRNLPQSDMSAVSNSPKAPLNSTLREQYYGLGLWELGITLGTSHAISDLGSGKDNSFNDFTKYHSANFGLNFGVFTKYRMNEWFALSMGMDFLSVSGERILAEESSNSDPFSFTNDVFEFFAKTEFYMPGLSRSPFDIYGFVGIGVFFSDARIFDANDRLVVSQVDYSQVQPVIPLGLGFSVKVTNNLKLGYEFGWRNTIFHYLDGVKPSSASYDHYFLNGLKISLVF